MPTTDRSASQVFISYSHTDKQWLDRLNVHIAPIKRKHSFAIWDDTTIKPGMNWDDEIKSALSSVQVAVLLVSADFLASEYIYNEELPVILNAAAAKGATVLSIIVSPCLLSSVPALAQIQSVNDPKNPLINQPDGKREELFMKVAEMISEKLNEQPAADAWGAEDNEQPDEDMLADETLAQIEKEIERFATNQQKGKFLVISIGEVYVQLADFPGTEGILFEAVSNKELPKEYKLNRAQTDELLASGFHAPDKYSDNYYVDCVLETPEDVQDIAMIAFQVLYGIHGFSIDVPPSFEYGNL